MRRILSSFICCLIGLLSYSQNSIYFDFNQTSLVPCPFDSSILVVQPEGWMIYQTLNDHWDGSVDSTKCFSVIDAGNSAVFNISQMDASKPLFVKSTTPKHLLANNDVYSFYSSMWVTPDLPIKTGSDCPDGTCTGIIIVTEIPDEPGTGTADRLTPLDFYTSSFGLHRETCLPTEKFEHNYLKQFVFKITFESQPAVGHTLQFGAAVFEWLGGDFFTTVTDIIAQPQHLIGSEYFLNISETSNGQSWSDSYLFPYTALTYPKPLNYSYVEAGPQPNTAQPKTINLEVNEWQSVYFQPFTQLRGGLVEGSDSIRHALNFINEGGNFCYFFIDLIFEGDTRFIYGSGNVDFQDAHSCMMFRRGAALEIADNSTFNYGYNGTGLLGLSPGGTIQLGENSALIINNRLFLGDAPYPPNEAISIYLYPGNSIVFGEYGSIERSQFATVPVMLDVYMYGGVFDDSNLSEQEKSLINKIYPPISPRMQDNISLFSNPNNGEFQLGITLPEEAVLDLGIYNMNGRLLFSENNAFPEGVSRWNIENTGLVPGLYIVKIKGEKGVFLEQMVVGK